MHKGRGVGQPEPDMAGDPRHRGNPRAHVEPRPRHAPAHRRVDAAFPGVGNAGSIAKENHVEQPALGDPRDVLEKVNIGVMAANPRARHPPRGLHLSPGDIEREMHLLRHYRDTSDRWYEATTRA